MMVQTYEIQGRNQLRKTMQKTTNESLTLVIGNKFGNTFIWAELLPILHAKSAPKRRFLHPDQKQESP